MSLRKVCAETLEKRGVLVFLATAMFIALRAQAFGPAQNAMGVSTQPLASTCAGDSAERDRSPCWNESKRFATVADAIQMTRIAGRNAIDAYGGSLSTNFASFSPDGKRVVFIVKKGNLQENTNEYSMLLYAVSDLFDSPSPKTLVSFASSSNRAAVDDLSWLGDSDTILFLGEQPGETTQLYSVECTSGKIHKLTSHPTRLLDYSASARADRIAYFAERSITDLADESVLRHGFHVSDERLSDLIAGKLQDFRVDLLVTDGHKNTADRLGVPNILDDSPLFVSPDGQYLVLRTLVGTVPANWHGYTEPLLQHLMLQKLPPGIPTQIQQYTLIDLKSGQSRALLDSPVSFYGSEVKWLPDSRTVVLTGVYLPLDSPDSVERGAREKAPYVVEVDVATLETSKIADRDMEFVDWNPDAQVLKLKERRPKQASSAVIVKYRKRNDAWEQVKAVGENAGFVPPDIFVEQDLNAPPRVVAANSRTAQRATLLELNPQFKDIVLGKVAVVKWIGGADHEIEGGLYLPPDYVSGTKYPLVIQTHGFDPAGFWFDGPFSTAFAAQPLAAKGIVVLQVPDSHDWSIRDTPQENPMMMETFERAIDYLDQKGVIDRDRVGLIGFSQTCLYVQYTLTHSKYKIAAAVAADGIDGGYFQYMAFANSSPYMESIREGLIGAPPFGGGLRLWLDRSPGFLLDRVKTPILIQAIRATSLPDEWEWFAGLSRLNKPVDFVYIPSGYHILQKPWDRMVSQQGDVDWFRFWLKGEEDPDPAKAGQYTRWNSLRVLANQDSKAGVMNR
jgi:dipeptidyl aminopeptidase/acylaminoacyl peptidase